MPDLPEGVVREATEAYRSAVTSGIAGHRALVRIVLEAAARFEDPSGEPYTVSPASKLPGAAVRAAAEAMQEEEDTRTWPTALTLARIALEAAEPIRVAALAGAGLVVVSACVCGQPIGVCHSCGQPRCWHCDPGLGRHHQPMRCNGRHEPAALPERTENA